MNNNKPTRGHERLRRPAEEDVIAINTRRPIRYNAEYYATGVIAATFPDIFDAPAYSPPRAEEAMAATAIAQTPDPAFEQAEAVAFAPQPEQPLAPVLDLNPALQRKLAEAATTDAYLPSDPEAAARVTAARDEIDAVHAAAQQPISATGVSYYDQKAA